MIVNKHTFFVIYIQQKESKSYIMRRNSDYVWPVPF